MTTNRDLLAAMQQNGNLIIAHVGDKKEEPKKRPELKPNAHARVIGNELHVRKYSDPGHGWLAVPVRWLEELGIVNIISEYSYINGNRVFAYLEEDCDESTFRKVAEENGFKVFVDEWHENRRSRIRSYSSFTTGN